jgi:hypothetical protein
MNEWGEPDEPIYPLTWLGGWREEGSLGASLGRTRHRGARGSANAEGFGKCRRGGGIL